MPSLMLRAVPPDMLEALRRYGANSRPTLPPAEAAVLLLRRALDMPIQEWRTMEFSISHTLGDAIDRASVEVSGRTFPLRLVSVYGVPAHDPQVAELTAVAVRDGQTHRATVGISLTNLDNEEYVVGALKETMSAILRGDLKPGERRLIGV